MSVAAEWFFHFFFDGGFGEHLVLLHEAKGDAVFALRDENF